MHDAKDRVAGCLRGGRNDRKRVAEDGIEKRRLADVRPSNESDGAGPLDRGGCSRLCVVVAAVSR
jgi:hypothetical protein